MNQESKIEEMQILEQNLQNILFQKQAFQMELSEMKKTLKEIGDSKDEIFKIVGQLMIKTEKTRVIEELSNKEKILGLRIKSIEKQENSLIDRLEPLKEEILEQHKKIDNI